MSVKVLIVHAEGEEVSAELLADPIREAGYEPVHFGTILVGDSFTEEASNLLAGNGPLVLCGTIKAAGTGLPYRLLNAARSQKGRVFIFPVRMEVGAYLDVLASDAKIADYAANPAQALADLLIALRARCPLDADTRMMQQAFDLESRYRALALKACDIVDLANLPEDDRHLASRELELRRLYVALRLRLEVRADDEVGEQTLLALEQQRRTGWGGQGRNRDEEEKLVSLGERLGAARRLVVLGDPGAGKSTLLRWLATAYLLRLQADPDWQDLPDIASLPETDWLPILIRCRDLPPEAMTLDTMLQHSLRKSELAEEQCEALRGLLRGKLERGKALLLIDGLDEITDPGARARFAEQIEAIHRAFPEAPVVATSRIVGYREMGYRIRAGFEHLTVADLARGDKDDFARRWCGLTEPPDRRVAAAEDLIHDIHSSDRIERLTGNPMLLTTMALIKRKIGSLPQRRVDLYEKAVEVLLNWRSAVDAALDAREALPQLEYLAHAMCSDGIQQLREDQALEWLCQCRTDYPNIHPLHQHSPEAFLALLERRTGLLVQSGHTRHQGRSVPVYEFRHLTVQEYLAGLALVAGHYRERDPNRSLAEVIAPLAGHVGKTWDGLTNIMDMAVVENWREALRLCLALCPDDQVDGTLLGVLHPLPGEQETTRPRAVQAALCLADEPNAGSQVAEEIIQSLVAVIRTGDGNGRVSTSLDAAVMELAGSRWAAALGTALLDEFFRQPDPAQRHISGSLYGILQAARLRQATVSIWLIEAATRLAVCDEREATGIALSVSYLAYRETDCRVPGLADGVIRCLAGGAAARHAAAWALGWMTNKRFEQTRVVLEPAQRARLVETVAREDCDSEALRFLSRVLAEHRIMEALGAIGEASDVAAIQCYFKDPDRDVRRAALHELARTCEDEVDRRLLHEGLSDNSHALDPLEPITAHKLFQALPILNLPEPEIRQRYERLAERFGLKLEWTSKPA